MWGRAAVSSSGSYPEGRRFESSPRYHLRVGKASGSSRGSVKPFSSGEQFDSVPTHHFRCDERMAI
jgi:hypothetical protein